MGNLSSIFDGMGTKPENDYSPLPEGNYKVEIVKADVKETKDGTGNYINVQYKVVDGPCANRVFFGMVNIKNKNPEAQRIGQEQFYNLRTACGLQKVTDTDQLIGYTIEVSLGIKKSEQYGDQNNIKKFSAIAGAPKPAAVPTPTAPTAPAGAPPWAKKPEQPEIY
jgi:hypothetical protein